MSNMKLNNVININNNFLTEISFKELKKIYDSGNIKIDLSSCVPYIPLEDNNEIHLNIDKNFMNYNKNTKELTIKDEFIIMKGSIRFINFIKYYDSKFSDLDKKVILNISCFYTSEIAKMLIDNK